LNGKRSSLQGAVPVSPMSAGRLAAAHLRDLDLRRLVAGRAGDVWELVTDNFT
jgi:hypothetical protein